jgi:uncharacterized protein YigA (DUF484 family)
MDMTRIAARLDTLTDMISDIRAEMARQNEAAKRGDPVTRREIARIRDRLTALENSPRRQLQVSAATIILWLKLARIAGLLLANLPLGTVAGVAGSIF